MITKTKLQNEKQRMSFWKVERAPYRTRRMKKNPNFEKREAFSWKWNWNEHKHSQNIPFLNMFTNIYNRLLLIIGSLLFVLGFCKSYCKYNIPSSFHLNDRMFRHESLLTTPLWMFWFQRKQKNKVMMILWTMLECWGYWRLMLCQVAHSRKILVSIMLRPVIEIWANAKVLWLRRHI